ncbi:MAG: sulfite exporter TauE/SafE family protein [Rouxiella aceris]|uniref:sulfite exporter TauE/SafE family protein n=1 Tax=Rouxiella aceris TaxID=2703884 RepID=UPI00284ABEED|nr:sulfite exporter TauE/SafE family protein [Rouxiella aceris]MDR3432439.1 sulfite exporter TauE/SafE family protein [Rouxiella aceris]
MEIYLYVFLLALAAGTLSGMIGTGSSLLLLPMLVHAFGPRAAMPVMAIAAIIGNLSRMVVWWRQIDWRAAVVYALFGMPAASLGAHTLLALPAWIIDCALGLFFWGMLPLRRYLHKTQRRLSLVQLSLCGAGIGFLTGLVLSTGPMSVPVFTAYGLRGGAFLATEAASALLLYSSKVGTFVAQDALSWQTALQGLLVGAGIMLGTVGSKSLLLKFPARTFDIVIDLLLFISGAALLYSAWCG